MNTVTQNKMNFGSKQNGLIKEAKSHFTLKTKYLSMQLVYMNYNVEIFISNTSVDKFDILVIYIAIR